MRRIEHLRWVYGGISTNAALIAKLRDQARLRLDRCVGCTNGREVIICAWYADRAGGSMDVQLVMEMI